MWKEYINSNNLLLKKSCLAQNWIQCPQTTNIIAMPFSLSIKNILSIYWVGVVKLFFKFCNI